ncbi:progranulin-like isoform X2 [Salminus brasiliensis]|uniref:progranulin-like isoform X2 n=1 Tax=Salminus brasiliensis TaxID=930266 RepID=UPI003B82F5D1
MILLVVLMAGLVSSDVTCPDGKKCPDKNTCCQVDTGYACCPYPNAVCCPDKAHCCPEGFQCDQQSQHCVKQGLPWYSFPMSPQIAAEETEEKPSAVELSGPSPSVVHCDNYHTCPDDTTCCRTPQGQWTCCIYRMGQCCPDGFHCCPYGLYCDRTSTHCLKGALSLPAALSHAPMLIHSKQDQCCLSDTGCCPNGFHCDEESRACVSDFDQHTPMVPLELALDTQIQAGVIRCNGRFYCPAEYTCCKAPTGGWGCCPYKLGQCCKDGKHCCEYGYKCDVTYSQCKKGYSNVPARPRKTALFL